MNKVYGVEILNKSITAKEEYYTKLLNCLHDVYIHLGYTPDPKFIESLRFSKAKTSEDVEEVRKLYEFEENKIKSYSGFLCDAIYKDFNRVTPEDKLSIILFSKENPDYDEFFDGIVYKSECKNCQVEDMPKTKSKVYKNNLGQFVKEY
jgi:hypothetical protein